MIIIFLILFIFYFFKFIFKPLDQPGVYKKKDTIIARNNIKRTMKNIKPSVVTYYSGGVKEGSTPTTQAALHFWSAIDNLWKRNKDSFLSLVASEIRLPSSWMNSTALEHQTKVTSQVR